MTHPRAWLAWLAAVLAALSATRSPPHLALALLCVAVVGAAWPGPAGALPAGRAMLLVVPVAALINGLGVRAGATVLLTLPLVGAVSLEALVYGALGGLALAGLFAAFAVVQRAVPLGHMVRLVPRAFYPLAVMAAVAVTFVPVTLRQARQVREAQAVRGHRLRQAHDWLPLLLPLLVGGIERALQLAESMAARGFAGSDSARRPLVRLDMAAGLAALLGGWLLWALTARGQAGIGLMLAGGAAISAALWAAGRGVKRTQYRPLPWTPRDTAVVVGALVTLAAFVLPLPGVDRLALAYSPYPRLALPPFDPVLGFATLGLAFPALAREAPQEEP